MANSGSANSQTRSQLPGFTIVELLVVIVVIGVLAAITTVSYSGITARAQLAKMNDDLTTLSKAIQMARVADSKTLGQITGRNYTAYHCTLESPGTDLATLSRSHDCWVQYLSALDAISSSSGVNVRNMVDPWGRPYAIDENEGEGGTCTNGKDLLYAYAQPFNGVTSYPGTPIQVPFSGITGCT